jgi:hypothetical protein
VRLANVLRRLSLIGGFLAAGYRLWYELTVVEANPFYVPPSGYRDTFGHALWINVSDLALACAAYFVAVWLPLQIVARALGGFSGPRPDREMS